MKTILFFGLLTLAFISCEGDVKTPNETSESASDEVLSKDSLGDETGDIYAQDWEQFKQAVIYKDKDAVLFFVAKNDQSLRDILELSYDYIFDDQMIENIEEMNYQDLPVSNENSSWRELSTYYFGEVDGEIYESGTFLYFEERPEGLRIVNYLAAG
ncbi:hypothetical protein [Parvicella tangerina]|nr:hypothetical protein [Parvicella tangerina]